MRSIEPAARLAVALAAVLSGPLGVGTSTAQESADPQALREAERRLEARVDPGAEGPSVVFYYSDDESAALAESSELDEPGTPRETEAPDARAIPATVGKPTTTTTDPRVFRRARPNPARAWQARVQRNLPLLHRVASPRALRAADRVLERAAKLGGTPRGRAVFGASALCLLALGVVGRWLRGRGDLIVCLDYPSELRGTFSVRIATQRGRFKRASRSGAETILKGGVSTRTDHHSVSRETQFRSLPPGRYFVSVEGVLQDPDNEEILSSVLEEQPVRIHRNGAARLEIDVSPATCPVDVRISWDERPANDAVVAARGLPQSLRFARDGATRIQLTSGRHTILVGCGDRVAEREVEVDSHRPTAVAFDLSGADHLVFKGCPPAVQPYLHGDLNAAARALERDGHVDLANLMLARLHQEHGDISRAAAHFESAGRLLEAAELVASLSRFEKAAELFEQLGDPIRAAEMHKRAGHIERAGDLWRSAGDIDSAVDCYRDCNAVDKWIEALEQRGDLYPASQIAMEQGDRSRAIQLLQKMSPRDPDFAQATEQLVEAFEQEGHRDLAARKIEELIETLGTETASPDLHSHLAELLDQTGETERALEVLEQLRTREPTYPNIATRIEALRKQRSENTLSASQGTSVNDGTPTAFLSRSRYVLLEEIGRGGMGVVHKARDQRLDRIVALKQLPATLQEHPKAIQLFLREAQAAARLNHPNIVTVYDTDQQDGWFFITMELLKGRPLNAILRKRGRIPPASVARLGVQIAAGLDYAHKQGIVHRDIKTANLFFTVDKVVKIMDFGLAKMVEEVRRGTTVIGGTPFYMAPEQAAGEAVSHRADLYAFGITLFELATGAVPFREGDVTYHHRHTAMPDPRERCAEIPDALAELILELTRKDPDERCSSAGVVSERLNGLPRS